MTMPSNKSSSSKPPGILRRLASQPEHRQSAAANPAASLHSFRRQSTQERLDEVLETARERVDTMSSRVISTGRGPSYRHSDDSPDETTSIVHGQSQRSYQSTLMKSDARNERATAQAPRPTDGEDGDTGVKHWLREYLDSIWTIELENKGSVARDHLALGRSFPLRPEGRYQETCTGMLTLYLRTNLPCLAADIIGVCIDRDSNHSVIPLEYLVGRR